VVRLGARGLEGRGDAQHDGLPASAAHGLQADGRPSRVKPAGMEIAASPSTEKA